MQNLWFPMILSGCPQYWQYNASPVGRPACLLRGLRLFGVCPAVIHPVDRAEQRSRLYIGHAGCVRLAGITIHNPSHLSDLAVHADAGMGAELLVHLPVDAAAYKIQRGRGCYVAFRDHVEDQAGRFFGRPLHRRGVVDGFQRLQRRLSSGLDDFQGMCDRTHARRIAFIASPRRIKSPSDAILTLDR